MVSDSPLIAAQAHTRRIYLVQWGNREQRYWIILVYNIIRTLESSKTSTQPKHDGLFFIDKYNCNIMFEVVLTLSTCYLH